MKVPAVGSPGLSRPENLGGSTEGEGERLITKLTF